MAELADAQVSEACDGDIVEVQVLSSAPIINAANPTVGFAVFLLRLEKERASAGNKNTCHGIYLFGVLIIRDETKGDYHEHRSRHS